jgi:hypothetical protein
LTGLSGLSPQFVGNSRLTRRPCPALVQVHRNITD